METIVRPSLSLGEIVQSRHATQNQADPARQEAAEVHRAGEELADPRLPATGAVASVGAAPSSHEHDFARATSPGSRSSQARLRGSSQHATRPEATYRQNLLLGIFSIWLMIGLFIDGWAHVNRTAQANETFATPWHFNVYAALIALNGWVFLVSLRNLRTARSVVGAIPQGWGWSAIGSLVYAISTAVDIAWHAAFGVEADLDQLSSPPHIGLFLGGILFTTTGLRVYAPSQIQRVISWKDHLPLLLSVISFSSLILFFFGPYNGYRSSYKLYNPDGQEQAEQILAIGNTYIVVAITIATPLYLLRRYRHGFAVSQFVAMVTAPLVLGTLSFVIPRDVDPQYYLVASSAVPALLAGFLAQSLRRSDGTLSATAFRVVAAVLAGGLTGTMFTAMAVLVGFGWSIETFLGPIFWSALLGLALSFLIVPHADAVSRGAATRH